MAKLNTYNIKWRDDVSTEWQDCAYVAMATETGEGQIKGESFDSAIANFKQYNPKSEITFVELIEAVEMGCDSVLTVDVAPDWKSQVKIRLEVGDA